MRQIFFAHKLLENKYFRTLATSIITIALAIFLIYKLLKFTDIRLIDLNDSFQKIPIWAVFVVVAITIINLIIGSLKWKVVVEHLLKDYEGQPGYIFYLFYTTLGAFWGLFLPIHVSTLVVRSISLRLGGYGSIRKGAVTSLISQFQDVIIISFFTIPGIFFLFFGINSTLWGISISLLILFGYIFNKYFMLRFIGFLYTRALRISNSDAFYVPIIDRFSLLLEECKNRKIFDQSLTLPLYHLSILRFVNLAFRSYFIIWILGLKISPIMITCISSLVQLSFIIAITPGNFGILEWGWVSLLSFVGVDEYHAGQFAFTNRILGFSSTIVGLVGIGFIYGLYEHVKKVKENPR